jgi:tripartite-type tricarboxylate transporter receptor subunit TctC
MVKAPGTREKFLAQGILASGLSPEEFSAFVKGEVDKWTKVAKAANIRVD